MTASFIGNNRALLGSQQRPLRFVFSSDFIQELTKSLLEVCFRFSSTYFNKFVSYPLQWHSTYPFKVWPKKDVSTRKYLSTMIFCSFDVSSKFPVDVNQPKTPSYVLRQAAYFPAAPENRFVCSMISLFWI